MVNQKVNHATPQLKLTSIAQEKFCALDYWNKKVQFKQGNGRNTRVKSYSSQEQLNAKRQTDSSVHSNQPGWKSSEKTPGSKSRRQRLYLDQTSEAYYGNEGMDFR